MKLKLSVITLLSIVFTYAFSLQNGIIEAKQPSPTTSPISSPITSPITGPVTFAGFKLQGKVTYKILGRWWKSFGKIIPAANVKVTAEDKKTKTVTETMTDSDGNYTFVLSEAKYRVDVDAQGFFVPVFRNVNLKKDVDGINFTGLTWNH